ncbi:hypothetical protein BerOc1_02678 [Pseudodesulfovibrio hydrargyri]|uniref:YfdX protein n=1 Tax=Pseudodesulfovibrio hydrargyri TaxID=2125990 RepID=A0A1J5N7G2_9BACT|nr:hypothetical protein [Pseudodesulfovibrio hydrargyri]OIQ50736.1 hypothetical protein BerOc1_02678 [Pseudodesulfovibrio hydrargyri]
MNGLRIFLIASLALLGFGCSTASMTLQLSMYTGETNEPERPVPMDEYDLLKVRSLLDNYKGQAEEIKQRRTELADDLLELLWLQCLVKKQAASKKKDAVQEKTDTSCAIYKSPGGLQPRRKKVFIEALDARYDLLTKAIALVETNVENYRQNLEKVPPETLTATLADRSQVIVNGLFNIKGQLEELGGNLGTEYEKYFTENIKSITTHALEQDKSVGAYSQLVETVRKINRNYLLDDTPPDKIFEQMTARWEGTAPLQVAASDLGTETLTRLTRTVNIQNTQIYRMQDPSDPVWKKVISDEDPKNWKLMRDKTWASAQGKAEIIIVQDTPLMNRIQQVHGDPSDMIASQLMISRAVTNTAISIAGKYAGIDLDLDNTAPAGPGNTGALSSNVAAKARLDMLKSDYDTAKKRLIAKLEALKAKLEGASGKSKITTVGEEIVGAVKGFKAEFKTIAGKEKPTTSE